MKKFVSILIVFIMIFSLTSCSMVEDLVKDKVISGVEDKDKDNTEDKNNPKDKDTPIGNSDIDDPNIDEPNTDEPNVDEPNIDEPNIDEPNTDEPNTDEQDIDEPDTEESDTEEHDTTEEDISFEDTTGYINVGKVYSDDRFDISIKDLSYGYDISSASDRIAIFTFEFTNKTNVDYCIHIGHTAVNGYVFNDYNLLSTILGEDGKVVKANDTASFNFYFDLDVLEKVGVYKVKDIEKLDVTFTSGEFEDPRYSDIRKYSTIEETDVIHVVTNNKHTDIFDLNSLESVWNKMAVTVYKIDNSIVDDRLYLNLLVVNTSDLYIKMSYREFSGILINDVDKIFNSDFITAELLHPGERKLITVSLISSSLKLLSSSLSLTQNDGECITKDISEIKTIEFFAYMCYQDTAEYVVLPEKEECNFVVTID